jgi:LysM repeat protein
MGLNLFKLEKLKIIAYTNEARSADAQIGKPLEVMFNPDSISVRHENKFSKKQGTNTTNRTTHYIYSYSREIKLNLIVDGTGVNDFGVAKLFGMGTKSVGEQIKEFLNRCYDMDAKIHEPRFLKIKWGDSVLHDFNCRLQSVDIEYSLFDRSGASLHAVLKATFIGDEDPTKRPLLEGKNSPDLTHTRVVKSGDTLPLLSKEIYGSSQYYLRLAQANNIDDFRNLTPGQQIIFPPLAKQGK